MFRCGALHRASVAALIISGLLAGTLRQDIIEQSSLTVEERVLSVADLDAAECIFLGNSVRGLVQACRLA